MSKRTLMTLWMLLLIVLFLVFDVHIEAERTQRRHREPERRAERHRPAARRRRVQAVRKDRHGMDPERGLRKRLRLSAIDAHQL